MSRKKSKFDVIKFIDYRISFLKNKMCNENAYSDIV